MLPRLGDPQRRYEEWRRRSSTFVCPDPAIEVGMADAEDLPEIYGVVNDAFGVTRRREVFEWLYEKNPGGIARVFILREADSRAIISCVGQFPWPLARGNQGLEAVNGGDSATVKRWQRKGLQPHLYGFLDALSRDKDYYGFGWPNYKSRAVGKKNNRSNTAGFLERVVLPLRIEGNLKERGWPSSLARMTGEAAGMAQSAWRYIGNRIDGRVENVSIRRFESSLDEVTAACMSSPRFWCPHDSEFLNWRYIEHPLIAYEAIAALDERGLPVGYAVVRTVEKRAWLMELAVPEGRSDVGASLLCSAIDLARDAGCEALEFAAPPRWRHWALLKRFGFRAYPSEVAFFANALVADERRGQPGVEEAARAEIRDLANWQCVPGDMDGL